MLRNTVTRAKTQRWMLLGILALALLLKLTTGQPLTPVRAQERAELGAAGPSLSGRVLDPLGEPVHEVEVVIRESEKPEPIAHATSQPDGSYLVDLPPTQFGTLVVEMDRHHFEPLETHLEATDAALLSAGESVRLPDVEMQRRITPAFWVATLSFVLVLVLIALEKLHKTTAALLGTALVLGVSFVGGAVNPDLFIFNFEQAL